MDVFIAYALIMIAYQLGATKEWAIAMSTLCGLTVLLPPIQYIISYHKKNKGKKYPYMFHVKFRFDLTPPNGDNIVVPLRRCKT